MGVNEAPCLDGLQQKIQKTSDQFQTRDYATKTLKQTWLIFKEVLFEERSENNENEISKRFDL